MALDRRLRGKLFCADEHGFSFAGEGGLIAVLPGPLIVCPRNFAQGAALQELYVLLMSRSGQAPDWAQIKREITGRKFFMAGPLLEAIEQEMRCVLLIDEIDKVDYAFEAMLLELLSVWTLSIPKLGTVRATSIPHVFLTSNQERRLGDPLRRRSFCLVVEHPNAEHETAIVAERTP